MNHKICEENVINLSSKQKFINATSEILEGDFHPSNPKLNLVGDYSKSVGCGDLDSMILYEVVHEKDQMRKAMFMHMIQPFWAGYDVSRTSLDNDEKFIIFLKILREVRNVYPFEVLEEIVYAMQDKLEISEELSGKLQNGKMWHDYYMQGYESYTLAKLKKDSKGLYW